MCCIEERVDFLMIEKILVASKSMLPEEYIRYALPAIKLSIGEELLGILVPH
ncbi:hypothetical protein M467_15620 [Exiguobacterium chiriqhucha RW-2]|uniref:Uncharacterized protein n=1 Tax=Exiguobacterium chiriqhucha RW-2 TaxID=1345023 RepID=U1LM79_9BACL|nr:hypothetical protein M467_15620 [Exiguobacterium chiriqhucha RW-2]